MTDSASRWLNSHTMPSQVAVANAFGQKTATVTGVSVPREVRRVDRCAHALERLIPASAPLKVEAGLHVDGRLAAVQVGGADTPPCEGFAVHEHGVG